MKDREPFVPKGPCDNSPAFQRWGPRPSGGKSRRDDRVTAINQRCRNEPSFVPPGLMSLARPNPAMNRWAIAVCPSGTYVFSALRTRHVRTESAGLALAAAFGVRQLVGAFARGTGGSAASWLALAERQRRQVAALQTLARLRNNPVCRRQVCATR